jgi:hypothetical protein
MIATSSGARKPCVMNPWRSPMARAADKGDGAVTGVDQVVNGRAARR